MLYNKWWKNTGDVCTRQVSLLWAFLCILDYKMIFTFIYYVHGLVTILLWRRILLKKFIFFTHLIFSKFVGYISTSIVG